MGLTDSLKRKVVGLVDREQRDVNREASQRKADERYLGRMEKEEAIKGDNLNERIGRRRMIKGDEPLSIRKYATSRARETKNNAKIGIIKTFNRDNLREKAASGAKSAGSSLAKRGPGVAKSLGNSLFEASVQSYGGGPKGKSSGRKHKQSSLSNDFDWLQSSPQQPQPVRSKKKSKQDDNYGMFGGSDARSIYSTNYSSVFGHASSYHKKKKNSSNPFDIDTGGLFG